MVELKEQMKNMGGKSAHDMRRLRTDKVEEFRRINEIFEKQIVEERGH
jgi:hypothetical protein